MASTKQKYRRTSKGVIIPQKGLMDRVTAVEKALVRSDLPKYSPGNTVRVHVRIKEGEKERIQIFEGIVISCGNCGPNRSFTVRKISHGVGVERIFLESSPKVAKLEVVQEGKVRRAKLYYLRNLEGKAAKIERDVESAARTSSSAKETKTSE